MPRFSVSLDDGSLPTSPMAVTAGDVDQALRLAISTALAVVADEKLDVGESRVIQCRVGYNTSASARAATIRISVSDDTV